MESSKLSPGEIRRDTKQIIISEIGPEHHNSLVEYEVFYLKLDTTNAISTIKQFDIVVDATDNYEIRYLLDDSCVILNKPMVHGAIYKFEGQASVFNFNGGPTNRCYDPFEKNADFINPKSSDTELMRVLPGITVTFIAIEVIKFILGTGTLFSDKLLIFNILNYNFHTINIDNIPENQITRERDLKTEY